MSRTKKTAINSIVGISLNVVSALVSFALQAVFIRLLGLEYSGINGLFTQILNILNLAELGFNNAIMFRLYKSISNSDIKRTELLLTTYKKICYLVGGFILVIGLCFIPFLENFVKETPKFPESLWSIYIIVLLTSSVSQALNYKTVFLIAKQERYIPTIVQYATTLFCHIAQIAVLALFHNIYAYLIVKLFTTVLNAYITDFITKRKYKIKYKSKESLEKSERKILFKDIGTLSVYKLCRTIDVSVDTFLITKLIAVATNAIYSSINMVLNMIGDLLGQFNDGMIASIGDINASEDYEGLNRVFYQSFHFTYLAFGICASVLTVIMQPFVMFWIGYSLSQAEICVMIFNIVLYGFGMQIATFRNSMGLFRKGWIRPAVTAFLNLGLSILLTFKIGLLGTLLGTTISRVITGMWYDPYIVIRYGLKGKSFKYFIRLLLYFIYIALVSAVLIFLSRFLPLPSTFISLFINGCIYLAVSVGLILLLGCTFKEQKALFKRLISLVRK